MNIFSRGEYFSGVNIFQLCCNLQLLIFCVKCLFSCLVGRGYTMYRLPIQRMYRSVVFLNNYSTQWFMRHCQLCVCIHINMGVFINNLLPYIVLIKKKSVKKSLKKVNVSFLTYTPVLTFVWSWSYTYTIYIYTIVRSIYLSI